MAVKIQVSQVIDRPIAKVFRFTPMNTSAIIRAGIRTCNLRKSLMGQLASGPSFADATLTVHSVDGTMEVVEFERNKAFGVLIHDGRA